MKKNNLLRGIIPVLLLAGLILGACTPKVTTPSPEFVMTNVAATVAAQFTKTAIAKPADTATPTVAPTKTLIPVTITPTAVSGTMAAPGTQAPGTTPAAATTVIVPGGQDAGVWARSNPVDGTVVDAGSKFKVVVTLLNTGTSTWTTDYYIKFIDGDQMGAPDQIYMPLPVPPQMSIDFTLEFTAPDTPKTAKSNWAIVNPNGVAFGLFWCEYKID